MATLRVGGEVDALCTRCKLTLAHTILAMVGDKIARVQCNTCGGAHAYRSQAAAPAPRTRAASSASSSGARSSAAGGSHKVTLSFEQRLAERSQSGARRYNPRDTFALDEVIEHPTFGYGIVTAVRSDKIDVVFKIFEKTLIHGRGGAPAERPSFSRPTATHSGSSDKPTQQEGDQADLDDSANEGA
jgi:hypothetical protein